MSENSEFRAYPFIERSLQELGWNLKNPRRYADGQVYTQNEALHDDIIGPLLEGKRPENLVRVTEDVYWAIEAKVEHKDLPKAISEAQVDYAGRINKGVGVSCRFATGVAGHDAATFLVETYFFDGVSWKRVEINSIGTTGFISRDQALRILDTNNANIENDESFDQLFILKANKINEILHKGAINKRNRARVIASLLLALADDAYLRISDSPTVLISDINARVKSMLGTFDRENFAQEIAIHLPTSKDNHRKNRRALVDCIQELRSINIRSAINSGSDLLGQFYEIFLKYANDAKEIGIVLTPRHITRFAAESLNISNTDYIYDPTTGTAGFLVAAFDKVKRTSPTSIAKFKKSHIFGLEQDPEVVGLALVNMIFRGDGNSNIFEGNTFDNLFYWKNGAPKRYKQSELDEDPNIKRERFITKTLMNPPFALAEPEYAFVDHALSQMVVGGLVFAVLPTSTMSSTSDGRGEITWRRNMLKRHTLKAVIKLSDDLFMPNAHKGTYAVILKAWEPHNDQKVFWAIMDDGFTMKKAKRMPSLTIPSNLNSIHDELQAFLHLGKAPTESEKTLGFKKIDFTDDTLDCGPEAYLDQRVEADIDLAGTAKSLFDVLMETKQPEQVSLATGKFEVVSLGQVIANMYRGDCPPLNQLMPGPTPVITTTESANGINGFYDVTGYLTYEDAITIPANGSTYQAFYQPFQFAAVPDILVCTVYDEFNSIEAKLFICSAINQSSWRFSYFRKCNEIKLLKDVQIAIPMLNGEIDVAFISQQLSKSPVYGPLIELLKK